MKTITFNGSLQNMRELSLEESEKINGGETLWYWIAYCVGDFVKGMTSGAPNSGQRLYNIALG